MTWTLEGGLWGVIWLVHLVADHWVLALITTSVSLVIGFLTTS